MNASTLLHSLNASGVTIRADGADLLLGGNRSAVTEHLDQIRTHKAELVALLTEAANDPAAAAHRWLVTLPDGERISLSCTPAATLADLQGRYPGAHIEPEPDAPPAPPLRDEDRRLASAYLDHIGETDDELRGEWMDGLAADPARLRGLYTELVRLELATWDDPPRTSCGRCRHFQPDPINPTGGLGRCLCDAPASHRPGSLWPWPDAVIWCAQFGEATQDDLAQSERSAAKGAA